MLTRWQVREPAVAVDVYALPARNEIDRASLASYRSHERPYSAAAPQLTPWAR
jgi:hypothetical protein